MNQMKTGKNQYEHGDECPSACIDKFIHSIENYIDGEGVISCKANPEAEAAINLTSSKIEFLNSNECLRHAYVLYQYCNYVQGIFNRHLTKLKWADEHLDRIVSSEASQLDKYMKWEQKRHTVIQNDEFAKILWELKISAEGKVTWLADKIKDMRRQADTLFELAKGKRYK